MTFADFQNQLRTALQGGADELPDDDRDAFLRQAIRQRYSRDRALQLTVDIEGNGTQFLDLPEQYEPEFSEIRSIEFPIGEDPEQDLEDDEWGLYRDPAGVRLRILNTTPAAGDHLRVTFTARHLADGSTVPDADLEAVCDFAAALCLDAIAIKYARTTDSTFTADVTNYRTKSQEFSGLAKVRRDRYFRAIGVDPDAGNETGPAYSQSDMSNMMGSGVDRLTHPRSSR